MRLRLTIAYDGRPFAGWQSQRGGNTIQDHIQAAMARILKLESPPCVHGSGRTDTGVHALAQVAHCDVPDTARMDCAAWRRALNVNLPPAIRIMEAVRAAPDFQARFHATGKTYRYRVWNDEVLPPLEAGLAWHVPHCLDLPLLGKACALCEGAHDFAGFAANRCGKRKPVRDTNRHLWSATPAADGPCLTITFHGDGFLYKMVRLLTGSMVRVSQGRESLAWFTELLTAPPGRKSHYLAPADGLYLCGVDYAPPTREHQ